MLARYRRQAGDTLIEVLLAVTVFSIVAVTSITIMNQSANSAQRALEITLVRQQIDSQAEALRAAHQAYIYMRDSAQRDASIWETIVDASEDTVDTSAGCPEDVAAYKNTFYLEPTTATLKQNFKPFDAAATVLYAQTTTDAGDSVSYGLWVEKSKVDLAPGSDSDIPLAYDFRIRACWPSVGTGDVPMQIETVVRLYDVS